MNNAFSEVLQHFRAGGIALLIDDGSSPAGGYLIASAISVSAEDITTMANHAKGVVCAAIEERRIRELGLPMMLAKRSGNGPDFTVSVESRQGVSTGISAADRARTLRTLAKTTQPKLDLVTPGHIFPIRAKQGGVLVRSAPGEATVDLLNLAGLPSTGVLTQCLDSGGALPSCEQLHSLAARLRIPVVLLSDVVRTRLSTESIIEPIATASLPTFSCGTFRAACFRSKTDGAEHLALTRGEFSDLDSSGRQEPVLVRVQSENRIGDLLGDSARGSRAKLLAALARIDAEDRGAVIYVRHPKAGRLKEQLSGSDAGTLEPASQLRQLGVGAQILKLLGISRIRLLSSSTREIAGVNAFGLEIVSQEAL